MKKHIVIKKKDNDKLYQEIFKRVQSQYDWAMKNSAECHFAHAPYFQQYFIMGKEKPKFDSNKVKDKIFIQVLKDLHILDENGEVSNRYQYNAFETKFGKKEGAN